MQHSKMFCVQYRNGSQWQVQTSLLYDQLWAASLIGRNAVTWNSSLSNAERVSSHPCDIANIAWSRDHASLQVILNDHPRCVTTVLIVINATVTLTECERSRAHKYLRKIKVNLRTKVGICISTYSNADVVCYITATWRTELNDVHLTDGGS